jgi:hypothetical protein
MMTAWVVAGCSGLPPGWPPGPGWPGGMAPWGTTEPSGRTIIPLGCASAADARTHPMNTIGNRLQFRKLLFRPRHIFGFPTELNSI